MGEEGGRQAENKGGGRNDVDWWWWYGFRRGRNRLRCGRRTGYWDGSWSWSGWGRGRYWYVSYFEELIDIEEGEIALS